MLTSIIITSYNYGEFLKEAIDSALAQTEKCEVIVVDDGSTDNTREIAESYGDKIKYIYQENSGLSAARNVGIRACQNDLIVCLDADDLLLPDYVKKLKSALTTSTGIVRCGVSEFGLSNRQYLYSSPVTFKSIMEMNCACATSMFLKKAWEEVGGFDEDMKEGYEDWDLWIRIIKAGYTMETVPEYLFLYRKHGTSMIDNTNKRAIEVTRYIRKKHGVLNILSAPVDDGGCGFYRIRQPFKKINKNTNCRTAIMDKGDDINKLLVAIKESDIIIMRPRSETLLWQLKKYIDEGSENVEVLDLKDKKFVLDHDDNTFEVSPLSIHYEELGTEEVETVIDGEKVMLWKDGAGNFDLKQNRKWAESLMKALNTVDLVTVTTPRLAEYYSKFNPNVAILPNCIDFNRFKPLNLVKDEWIRIGWSGGASHFIDWTTISEPLREIFEKYKNVKLVIAGNMFPGALQGIPEDRIEFHPWVESVAHPYHLATLNIDIAIIPLRDIDFNHYKSEIKYSEFSALKIPSLAAGIPPYSDVIEDNFNGLLYNSDEEFVKKLSLLIENKNLRDKLAKNAYEWVRDNRDADKEAHRWTDAFSNLSK